MIDFLIGLFVGRWTARRTVIVSQRQLEAARQPRSTIGVLFLLALLVAVLWLLAGPR
jgi:hypothetical protein